MLIHYPIREVISTQDKPYHNIHSDEFQDGIAQLGTLVMSVLFNFQKGGATVNVAEIIGEADLLVPNEVPAADKLIWINAINQDFFNVVKIPKIAKFTCTAAQQDYVLAGDIRSKNIDLLMVGMFRYQSLERDGVTPAQNAYSFDDASHTLSLFPAPYSNLIGVLRYRRIATTLYTSGNLLAAPDAPEEYHWTYIPALAAYLANTQDDGVKAANYENEYKSAWNVAAQNYQGGGN